MGSNNRSISGMEELEMSGSGHHVHRFAQYQRILEFNTTDRPFSDSLLLYAKNNHGDKQIMTLETSISEEAHGFKPDQGRNPPPPYCSLLRD